MSDIVTFVSWSVIELSPSLLTLIPPPLPSVTLPLMRWTFSRNRADPLVAVTIRERPSPSIVAPAPRPTILTPRPAGMTSSSPPSAKVVPCEGGRRGGGEACAGRRATPCVRDVPPSYLLELDHYDAGAREFERHLRPPGAVAVRLNLAASRAALQVEHRPKVGGGPRDDRVSKRLGRRGVRRRAVARQRRVPVAGNAGVSSVGLMCGHAAGDRRRRSAYRLCPLVHSVRKGTFEQLASFSVWHCGASVSQVPTFSSPHVALHMSCTFRDVSIPAGGQASPRRSANS